jgi:bacillithiol system protein YtxJ
MDIGKSDWLFTIFAYMNWQPLISEEALAELHNASFQKPQLIFKHSTKCSISSMALNRLNKADDITDVDCYLLDLISYRSISNHIAERYQVHHESPQVLLIHNGECIFDESHSGIMMDEILEQIAQSKQNIGF